MKRNLCIFVILIALFSLGTTPASAQNRYIVRTKGGLGSVLRLCLSANCQVQGSLDGNVNQTFLVTSSGNLVQNLLGFVGNLLEQLLDIVSVEADQLLPLPQMPIASIPGSRYNLAPVNYYGTLVPQGYVSQPANQLIRLVDAQRGFNVTGSGIV